MNDKSQVIASGIGDKQGFQIINMDVRFVYRIGLSDQAAQISAQALIARERGVVSEQTNVAQLQASIALDQASAAAREVNVRTLDLRSFMLPADPGAPRKAVR